MNIPKLIVFFLAVVLSSCNLTGNTFEKPEIRKLEKLYGIKISDSNLQINVLSTGCTKADDFKIDSKITEKTCEMSIYRIHPDLCKRAPIQETIQLSWDDYNHCKNATLDLKNEVLNLR